MKKVYIIANPSSGKKKAEEYAEITKNLFEENGQSAKVKLTRKKEDISSFATEACEANYDTVIIMGGDGTVSELIHSLKDKQNKPKIGIIPTGTVNNIARGLGIDTNLDKAVEALINSVEKVIDVGKINDQLFLSSVSAGSIPENVWEVTDEQKEKYGPIAYLIEGMKSLNNKEVYSFEIEIDGEKQDIDLTLLIIGISNSVLGITNFFNTATYDDGKLHMFGLKKTSISEKIFAFSTLFSAQDKFDKEDDFAFVLSFKKAIIRLKNKEAYVALDGEKGPSFPVKIEVLPSFVSFLVPN